MNREIIDSIPFFTHLNEKESKIVLDSLKLMKFKKGDIIIRQGDRGYGMYIIIAGKASVIRHDHEISRLSEDDFFGEMTLISDEPRSATIRVTSEDLVTFFLSKAVFREIEASLGEEIRQEIGKRNNQSLNN